VKEATLPQSTATDCIFVLVMAPTAILSLMANRYIQATVDIIQIRNPKPTNSSSSLIHIHSCRQLDITRYPYLVRLQTTKPDGTTWMCGGSLVAKDMVLTAAHCIQDRISGSVAIMRHNQTSNDGEEIDVKEWILHPQWNDVYLEFNYGLIVLERATTQNIKLIGLNSDENFPAPDSPSRVMGWGITEENKPSDVALEVDVNVISNVQCNWEWGGLDWSFSHLHI
jgi:secreted trypsin-like serine protease